MKIIYIRPKKDFCSIEEIIDLGAGHASDKVLMHFTEVPMLPVILDSNSLPLDAPNQFLSHVALRSRSVTGDTARTYAEALVTWLNFLEINQIELHEATEERLALFRNYLVNASTENGRHKYSPATINNRVVATSIFYSWVEKRGLMTSPLGVYLVQSTALNKSFSLQNPYALRRSNASFGVGVIQRMPRILAPEELARLFSITRQPYTLMFRWGLVTGLRRFEVCSLTRSGLATASQIAARGMSLVPIDVTRKGGKITTVYAPSTLVEETIWYCLTERPLESSPIFSDLIFLNHRGSPYSRGSLSRAFRCYADQIGSDATLHHLRHTFAILVLGMLDATEHRNGALNSIKAVQILLGHSNVTTTEIYLKALEVSTDEVRNALDYLYGATL